VGLSERTKKKYGPRLQRPDGVPKLAWPPHGGATRRWNRRTRRLVAIVEWKFDITCSTYPWHGNNHNNGGGNGERNAFDAWVHAPGSAATNVQEEYGDRVQNFIENNFRTWFYQIWWNWMRYYYASWFDHEPYWRDYVKQSGNPNPADNRHMNHVHTQVRKGRLRAALSAMSVGVGLVEDRPDNAPCNPPDVDR
jgi:hypothetical protein